MIRSKYNGTPTKQPPTPGLVRTSYYRQRIYNLKSRHRFIKDKDALRKSEARKDERVMREFNSVAAEEYRKKERDRKRKQRQAAKEKKQKEKEESNSTQEKENIQRIVEERVRNVRRRCKRRSDKIIDTLKVKISALCGGRVDSGEVVEAEDEEYEDVEYEDQEDEDKEEVEEDTQRSESKEAAVASTVWNCLSPRSKRKVKTQLKEDPLPD